MYVSLTVLVPIYQQRIIFFLKWAIMITLCPFSLVLKEFKWVVTSPYHDGCVVTAWHYSCYCMMSCWRHGNQMMSNLPSSHWILWFGTTIPIRSVTWNSIHFVGKSFFIYLFIYFCIVKLTRDLPLRNYCYNFSVDRYVPHDVMCTIHFSQFI